jgi:KaiC/GvpD/RAD55 family RecA-like ATPase
MKEKKYLKTGIPGFDSLFEHGIPIGSSVLVAGGTGSGKTNFCLQILANNAAQGKKCYFMGFEESEEHLIEHMEDFGWRPQSLIGAGTLKIKRFLTSEIYYTDRKSGGDIQAMMTKEVDPLLMELEPFSITDNMGFRPDIIVLDSLTALSSSFLDKDQSYRFYIERLFRFLEIRGCTTFLTTETHQIPEVFSPTGVEEFLSDGVVAFYNLRKGSTRETAIEVLKMRGAKHQKRIVPLEITEKGITVYPEKEAFSALE